MKTLQRNILIFCLAVTLLMGGCASPADNSPDIQSALPESLRALSFDEHLDISIGYWNIESMMKATEPDALTQYIEELFNITIHPVSVTWSNYKDRYQILSATNSLPDVFATLTLSSNDNNDSATFTELVETQAIQSLPADLSSYPVLSSLLESVPYIQYKDGKNYAIPRMAFVDEILGATDAAMLVRKDWMKSLGIDAPESFIQFAEMTRAFAMDDPDGNGLDDTIGYNVNILDALGKWVILGIAPQCNVYTWVLEDERYVPSWTTEAFEDVVLSYRYLYESGGLDPDFYSKAPNAIMEDFAAGRLGALEYKSSPSALQEMEQRWNELNEKPFDECVTVLPIFPASDGVRYSNSSSVFWSESFISSSASPQEVERILALFEFLLSERGQELSKYGLEGIEYQKTADGNLECLVDVGDGNLSSYLSSQYPSYPLFSGIATWGGSWMDFEESEMNYMRYGRISTQLARQSALYYKEHTTQLERPYEFLIFPKESTDIFSTSNALNAFINVIIGSEPPLDMWRDSLNRMKAQGLEEYIDRQNNNFHYTSSFNT